MSQNIANNTPDARLIKTINDLRKQVRNLKTNQNSVFGVPLLAADPASPFDGQMWINTSSNVLKVRKAGFTKTVTVT